ncbi:MAG: pyridoxal-phosphate dependent enzyme [Saprospiraceae bacterium]|nr:pyridoxal-phosphate dependent enzyme [Saprospiraceae bacterium]MCF8251095.1 pyridoxal-phosphate dependent enzyme [Saprospiraceae bacterium]MCF8280997.1 pyridoxal-phosphate dependent enzyme [Bacteroidales bacterium]MCF8312947.1 pyridoxal-phosphate dependent enzyme [Saprospiraceae bacterium]MCF8441354.1 pyridoxal-phosphate dependent enzyme [Saprospiraceae bacterium]
MTTSLLLPTVSAAEKTLQVGQLVGKTPMYEMRNVFRKPGVRSFAKLEWQQLGGSVKSRPAFNSIKNAVRDGQFGQGKHLLDATSSNTGAALRSTEYPANALHARKYKHRAQANSSSTRRQYRVHLSLRWNGWGTARSQTAVPGFTFAMGCFWSQNLLFKEPSELFVQKFNTAGAWNKTEFVEIFYKKIKQIVLNTPNWNWE